MKKVLITGGSGGIGSACVRDFAKKGYTVYFTYNNNRKKAEEIEKETGSVAIKCDISSKDDVKRLFEIVKNVDVLVNNAAISKTKMLCDTTEADWERMFAVNVKGMFLVTKAAADGMVRKKYGRIINISSMWGEVGASCEVCYSSTKAAVIGFTKSLAKELAPSGITVNCVSPGVIDTEMNAHLTEKDMAVLCEETPVMRIGKANEVSNAVMYLADEKAEFVTGTVLQVNGGFIL